MNDLTVSNIERQNVLNNHYAIEQIKDTLGITGMAFEGEYRFTKKMVADYYEVDVSTIDRYLSTYSEELKHNGYVLYKGKHLKEFKLQFAHLINEASKTTQLGLFNFRSFLNMGMLLTESEKAKQVRSLIDICRVRMIGSWLRWRIVWLRLEDSPQLVTIPFHLPEQKILDVLLVKCLLSLNLCKC